MKPNGKTAEQIETLIAKKLAKGEANPDIAAKYGRGKNPSSHVPGSRPSKCAANLVPYQWQKGKSGCPGGVHTANDVARKIARAIFENNEEEIYKQFAHSLLKGNAYAFQVLADRAYGKLKETHRVEVTQFTAMSDEDLIARIAELKSKLGVNDKPPIMGRIEPGADGTLTASVEKKD